MNELDHKASAFYYLPPRIHVLVRDELLREDVVKEPLETLT